MPNDDTASALEGVKREMEVMDRPGKVAPTPIPAGLQQHEYSNTSYKTVAPKSASKPKSEMDKSLDWNAQQKKVAESQ